MTEEQRTARIADRRCKECGGDILTTLRMRHDANVKKIRETEQQITVLQDDATEAHLLEVEKGLD